MNCVTGVLLVLCAGFVFVQGLPNLINRCTNDVQLRRFSSFLTRVDNNTNTILEYSDYSKTGRRLQSISTFKKFTEVQFQGPNGIVQQAWDVFPIITMTRDEFLIAAILISTLDPVLDNRVTGLANVMFKAFDYLDASNPSNTQGDGWLGVDELQGLWFTFGQTDISQLQEGFDDLDINHDNKIDMQEFISNGICFFASTEDDAPCRWFIGPDTEVLKKDFAIAAVLAIKNVLCNDTVALLLNLIGGLITAPLALLG